MKSSSTPPLKAQTNNKSLHTYLSLSSDLTLNMFSSSQSLSWTWTWSCTVFIVATYLVCVVRRKRSLSLPPGPKGLPILGNLLMLRDRHPHRDLQRLAKKYGPVMHLRLGFVPTIVVSSPQAAELFLKTHDLIFASRPFNEAAKYISYERKGLAFAEYGTYWQNVRKLCNQELLSNLKIESFKSMRREEMNLFIESLKEASRDRLEVDLSNKVKALSTDMSFRMVFGYKYIHSDDQRGFHDIVTEGDRLSALFNIADYFPCVGVLDLQGLAKRMKAVSRIYDDMLEKIIDEHIHAGAEGRTPDFVDIMLSYMESKENEFQIDRSNIKATLLDMLAGSVDTSSTAIEWAFSELLKHPSVMKKVQEEVNRVVGLDRMVDESDLVNFEYLDMIIKESFRLHPVVPLLIPHESTKDCTINGYHIPRKSRIIINTWAIGRDPDVWGDDADEFRPERFVGKNIDYIGRNFQFLPFGSGRRGCPGINLGLTVIKLVVAQLVHCFDWELTNGMLCTDINMDEEFGMTMLRANHLSLIPTYHLPNEDPTRH